MLLFASIATAQVKFDDYFVEKTMRFDYYHAGDARSEYFFFDEVIEEPYWAGNKNYLVDEREMGNHLFKVKDKASGKVIYQRGYSTLFAEWACTPEAKQTSKAMPPPHSRAKKMTRYMRRRLRSGSWRMMRACSEASCSRLVVSAFCSSALICRSSLFIFSSFFILL